MKAKPPRPRSPVATDAPPQPAWLVAADQPGMAASGAGQGAEAGAAPAFVSPAEAQPPQECASPADVAPSDAAERIRASASKGGSLKALHALFGVSADDFKRWMDADPCLRKAFDEGKEVEREALHRTIYEQAIHKRDLGAAQFLLKTRHGYRETEPEDTRNSVRIVFNLPAAAPDLKTYIEHNGGRQPFPLPTAPKVIADD